MIALIVLSMLLIGSATATSGICEDDTVGSKNALEAMKIGAACVVEYLLESPAEMTADEWNLLKKVHDENCTFEILSRNGAFRNILLCFMRKVHPTDSRQTIIHKITNTASNIVESISGVGEDCSENMLHSISLRDAVKIDEKRICLAKYTFIRMMNPKAVDTLKLYASTENVVLRAIRSLKHNIRK